MSSELAPAPRARFWIPPGQHAPQRSRSPAPGCNRDRIPPPAARAHQLPPPCSSCTPWTPCAFVARGETRQKPSGRNGRSIQGWDRGRCQEGYRRFHQHMPPSRVRYVTSVPYVTRTGNEEYQFGDFTRSAVEGTKVGVEDAVKKVTGNEEYQCNTDSNLKLAARGVKPQPSPRHPCGPHSERPALGAREQLVTSRRAFSRRPTSP